FAGKIIWVVMLRNFGIGLRIPDLRVYAVCNTDQAVGPEPGEPLETVAVFRRLNLIGVPPRDCRERVGNFQSRLHRGGIAVKGKCVSCKFAAEPEFPQFIQTKTTLVSHVVDRENGPRVSQIRIPTTQFCKLSRRKSRVPVVEVNDI